MIDYDKLNLDTLAREFAEEEDSIKFVESLLWPNGPVCPHCKTVNKAWKLTSHTKGMNKQGKPKRPIRKGLWKCGVCFKQFTVRMGTVFEESKIPLRKWLQIIHLMTCSKKGISSHQIARQVGVTQRTGWFASMRVREAMKQQPLAGMLQGVVEVDETYVGGRPRFKRKNKCGRGTKKKPVMVLVERNGGVRVKALERVTGKSLKKEIAVKVAKEAVVITDELSWYRGIRDDRLQHRTVHHSIGEYARLDPDGLNVHTNTAESFFSLLKRGHYGIFHQLSRKHLHRYCDEFGFRWNRRKTSDGRRMIEAIKATEGKRLMYREPA